MQALFPDLLFMGGAMLMLLVPARGRGEVKWLRTSVSLI